MNLYVQLPCQAPVKLILYNMSHGDIEKINRTLNRKKCRVPCVTLQQLIIIRAENPADGSSEDFEFNFPNEANSFYEFQFQPNLKYTMSFDTDIVIKKLPESGLFAEATTLTSVVYNSSESFEELLKKMTEILAKYEYTVNDLVDASSGSFGETFPTSLIEREKTYFISKMQASYSHCSLSMMFRKVELFLNGEHVEASNTKNNANFYLDLLDLAMDKKIQKTGGLSPIEQVVARVKGTLGHNWDAGVLSCCQELKLLNNHMSPSDNFSEAARRLLINEVVKKVMQYNDSLFSVEEQQNDAKHTPPSYLGWGPLDFTLYGQSPVVMQSLEDPEETMTTEETPAPKFRAVDIGGSSSSSSSSGGISGAPVASVEAKTPHKLTDKALAQGGCQTHDCMVRKSLKTAGLLLCSGHRWKFYMMFHRDGKKPVLVYLGELCMPVLRSPVTLAAAATAAGASSKPKGKRPSGLYFENKDIDQDKVESVMLALHCSLHSNTFFDINDVTK